MASTGATQIDFPYHFDNRRRTAATGSDDHIRDLIEQVIFTSPGERPNRPTFGSGLLKLVFEPNSDLLATSLQHSVSASLQQWLGDLIQVESVKVESRDETLYVTVVYTVQLSQQRQIAQFSQKV